MEIFCLTSQKKSALQKIIPWFCLLCSVACLFLACGNWWWMIVLCFLFGFLFYFLQFKSNMEYECSYFDGEVRFARVRAKCSRKALKHYSMDEVVTIAPAGDRSMYKYENDRQMKVFDYTSRVKGTPYYEMIIKSNETLMMYKVELDDKILDAMTQKYSYKIIRVKKQ